MTPRNNKDDAQITITLTIGQLGSCVIGPHFFGNHLLWSFDIDKIQRSKVIHFARFLVHHQHHYRIKNYAIELNQ